MVRRRQKRKQRKWANGVVLSREIASDKLLEEAQAAMAHGRFKQAVAAFKILIKRERRPQWLDGLGRAYAARAAELAEKEMFREAAAIWEQRAETCEKPLEDPNYLLWLLWSGRERRAISLFEERARQFEPEHRAVVREHLAALALSGRNTILEQLPSEDPVVRNYAAADEVLQAYCSYDAPALAAALKRIPFRSPYRAFGRVIKALNMLEKEPQEAQRQLALISESSPFSGLAAAARAAVMSVRDMPEIFKTLDADSRTFVASLKGWSRPQLDLLRDAGRKGEAPNAKALLDLLVRHRELFSLDFAREASLQLLIHYPEGRRLFSKAFGLLSMFDEYRIDALMAEAERDLFSAADAWRYALEELRRNGSSPLKNLHAALILRHIVDLHAKFDSGVGIQLQTIEDLEESLRLDPEDHGTWFRLNASYRERGDLKGARRSVDEALARFPHDPDILLAAVETAIAGDAYKKAARYAKSLLVLDPINPKVKTILLESHIAHARKQIAKVKLELASKELDAAASWVRSEADGGKLALLHGILEFSRRNPEQARAHLRKGVIKLGGGLAGRLHLLLEADRLQRHPDTILKLAELHRIADLSTREEVLRLAQAINNFQGDDVTRAASVLESLIQPIKRAVGQPFSQSEMELVCEVLHRTRQFNALRAYAKRALKRWRNRPVFVYHSLYARRDGDHFMLSNHELDRLQRAVGQAREEGDTRTSHRILEWVEPPMPMPVGPIGPPGSVPMPADLDEIGIASFLDMLDAFGGLEGLSALREVLEEDQMRKFIELLASGDNPGPFLDQVLGDARRGSSPVSRKKRKPIAKPKPESHVPQQGDLFE